MVGRAHRRANPERANRRRNVDAAASVRARTAVVYVGRKERCFAAVVRVAVALDPWTLSLARRIDGLPVVDPVGLWLDCASEGERALEAAEVLADIAGWS